MNITSIHHTPLQPSALSHKIPPSELSWRGRQVSREASPSRVPSPARLRPSVEKEFTDDQAIELINFLFYYYTPQDDNAIDWNVISKKFANIHTPAQLEHFWTKMNPLQCSITELKGILKTAKKAFPNLIGTEQYDKMHTLLNGKNIKLAKRFIKLYFANEEAIVKRNRKTAELKLEAGAQRPNIGIRTAGDRTATEECKRPFPNPISSTTEAVITQALVEAMNLRDLLSAYSATQSSNQANINIINSLFTS